MEIRRPKTLIQHRPNSTCVTQLTTCLLMKCLKGFSSSSSGMFSIERSTDEHRELFLEAEIFLVAIFIASSNSFCKNLTNYQLFHPSSWWNRMWTELSDGEMCGLYRAGLSKGAGAYLCTFQSNACADTQNTSLIIIMFFVVAPH